MKRRPSRLNSKFFFLINVLQDIHDYHRWEQFEPLTEGIFLQSSAQKILYEMLGQKTWLLERGTVRSLVTKIQAKRGTFLFLPYGPLTDKLGAQDLRLFFQDLKTMAKDEGACFIRISPFWPETSECLALLDRLGFRKAPIHLLAETLWMLPLQGQQEEQLLSDMDKKHRNLIRRAEKDGVTVEQSSSREVVERFLDLHWQTVERHQFTPYPKAYFRSQVELFSREDQVQVFEAWYQGHLLASAIIMFYGKTAAYHHGASSSDPAFRKIPASYLLQWEVIRESLRRKCVAYNLWGIAPPQARLDHPFYGITHFKTGFGGSRVDLVSAHDLVVSPKYYLNWAVEKARKWRRGF